MIQLNKSDWFTMAVIFIAVYVSWLIFPVDFSYQPIFTAIISVISFVIGKKLGNLIFK